MCVHVSERVVSNVYVLCVSSYVSMSVAGELTFLAAQWRAVLPVVSVPLIGAVSEFDVVDHGQKREVSCACVRFVCVCVHSVESARNNAAVNHATRASVSAWMQS